MSTISVIIPNYNHGSRIPNLLRNIFEGQERQPEEIIIIDDGSTDNSREILEEEQLHWPKLRIHFFGKNQGMVPAVYKGLELSTGDLLVLRAADDIDLPGYYDKAASLLEAHPLAALCCGDISYFGRDICLRQTEPLGLSESACYLTPDQLVERFSEQPLYGHAIMIRKSAFIDAGKFHEDMGHLGDWFCFIAAAFRTGLCYLPQAVIAVEQNPNSFGNKSSADNTGKEKIYQAMFDKLHDPFQDISDKLLASNALAFLGQGLTDWASKQLLTETVPSRKRLLERLVSVKECRTRRIDTSRGIPFVIKTTIQNNYENLKTLFAAEVHPRIAVAGAGGHTQQLLAVWSQFDFPEIEILLSSEAKDDEAAFGLPIQNINSGSLAPSLIILSSKSFEEKLHDLIRIIFPNTPILSFWDRALTRLGG